MIISEKDAEMLNQHILCNPADVNSLEFITWNLAFIAAINNLPMGDPDTIPPAAMEAYEYVKELKEKQEVSA